MPDWLSYTLSDLAMFSEDAWWRLLARYNDAIWPAPLAGLALGAALPVLLARPSRHGPRLAAGLLAAAWLWVAVAFHVRHYSTIHWAAPVFAAAFGLQALLLGLGAVRARLGPEPGAPLAAGLGLVLLALVGLPAAALLLGRDWRALELLGTAPDPTAIAALGVLAAVRAPWWLIVLPVAWCLVSGATLGAIGASAAWLPPAAAAAAVGVRLLPARGAAGAQPS